MYIIMYFLNNKQGRGTSFSIFGYIINASTEDITFGLIWMSIDRRKMDFV